MTNDDDDWRPDIIPVEDETSETIVEEEDPYALPEYPEVPIPELDPDAAPAVKIDEAPAYVKSPEQLAWEAMYGGTLQEIIAEGGKGIDEETQALMKRRLFDDLKARETENLRLLRNNMETRGITNSGLIFSEEQKIKSTTTRAMASGMVEIKIKSAFMKMASFENALGQAGQFLGYLARQSMYGHSVEMAQWQMEQQAKLVQYQANIDIFKIKLQDAYTKENMYLQQQLQSDLNAQVHSYNVELAEMEIEAAKEKAKWDAGMNLFGIILGGISALI